MKKIQNIFIPDRSPPTEQLRSSSCTFHVAFLIYVGHKFNTVGKFGRNF